MSFDFNPSSDEEDEGQLDELWRKAANESTQQRNWDDEDDYGNGAFSFEMATSSPAPTHAAVAKLPMGFGFGETKDSGDDDADSVDWEDVAGNATTDDLNPEDADKKLPADTAAARPLQPVTIDLGSKPPAKKDDDKKKKKVKTRRRYTLGSLPRHTQSLLINLHMAHCLLPVSWTDNSTFESGGNYNVPSKEELQNFCSWYFDLVHKVYERRNRAIRSNMAEGAPRQPGSRRRSHSKRKRSSETTATFQNNRVSSESRLLEYCSYLSASLAEDPQLLQQEEEKKWSSSDRINLLIAMVRSLGWRARYVATIEPIQTDLDHEHPMLLGAMTNVFQAVSSWSQTHQKADDPKPRKRPQQMTKKDECIDLTQEAGAAVSPELGVGQDLLGWVEVLCRVDSGNPAGSKQRSCKKQSNAVDKKQLKWVHVDPEIEVIDQPHRVETLLFEQHQQSEGKNDDSPGMKRKSSRGTPKKQRPVAYVVAAEHAVGDSQRTRVTDVTPRYAASMVETLKLRGIPAKNQAKTLSHVKTCWWSKAINSLNGAFNPKKTRQPTSKAAAKADKPLPSPSAGKSAQDAIDVLSDEDYKEEEEDDENEDGADSFEKEELAKSASNETMPTSKEKFKNHPLYVIPSVLKKTEVLAPDAKKRMCGIFKGQMVYSRKDVSQAIAEKKWLYQGRKVKRNELGKPVKRVKARAKPKGGGSFKALGSYGVGEENDGSTEHQRKQVELAEAPLDDGLQDLYAIWQTNPWSPPYVGPNDNIPVNEYNNMELELINPGLAHIDVPKLAPVAKQLGIPYAPCLMGFEGHGGNRTPTIRGIVVHEHNAQLLREASVEVESKSIEDENEKRRRAIYAKWKKLIVGVLTKDRLEREYG